MDFKYKTKFESIARRVNNNLFESKASKSSLEDLHKLFPDKEEMIKDSSLLLYVCANIGVANLVNLNNHGITGEAALSLKNSWAKKPINVEHERESVVGVITNSGFSKFGSNEMIDYPEDINAPFNMCASGYIWKHVGNMAEIVEDSTKEGSYFFESISTSWEVGFSQYFLAKGSRNLSRATIIKDPQEIEANEKYLIDRGGDGFDDDGNEVYMVITGPCEILGFALTTHPAAAVSSLSIFDTESVASILSKDKKSVIEPVIINNKEENSENQSLSSKKEEKNENKISQIQELSLNIKSMTKPKNLDEAYTLISQAGVSVDPIKDLIEKGLREAEEKFVSEQKAKREKEEALAKQQELLTETLDAVKTEKEKLEATLSDIQKKFTEQTEALAATQKEMTEIRANEVFNSRMDALAEKYNLNDNMTRALASLIKGKNDEEYKQWLDSDVAKVVLASCQKKENKDEVDEVIDALEESKANTEGFHNKSITDLDFKNIKFELKK